MSICEDAWSPVGPIAAQAAGGAELVVNINASPYYANRLAERSDAGHPGVDASCALVYVNLVGGQDELVFDGASMVFDGKAATCSPGRRSSPRMRRVSTSTIARVPQAPARPPRPGQRPRCRSSRCQERRGARRRAVPPGRSPPPAPVREVYEALVSGTRDYVCKNGFTDAVIGLSGGIDSSLVAAIAVDALGPRRPRRADAVALLVRPGCHDAEKLALEPGHRASTVAIEAAHGALLDMLGAVTGAEPDMAEENLQSRIRGLVLMALSNKYRAGWC